MGTFMSGKMKVKGDTGVALKLQTLFVDFLEQNRKKRSGNWCQSSWCRYCLLPTKEGMK